MKILWLSVVKEPLRPAVEMQLLVAEVCWKGGSVESGSIGGGGASGGEFSEKGCSQEKIRSVEKMKRAIM